MSPSSNVESRFVSLRRGAFVLLALASACSSPQRFERESDAIVGDILGGSSERLNENRRATVETPRPAPPQPEPEPSTETTPASTSNNSQAAAVLSLRDALEHAVTTNRAYIGELESLYQQALSLHATRHGFGPLLSATLNSLFSGTEQLNSSSTSFGLSVSQRLPWGGRIATNVDATSAQAHGVEPDQLSSGASISLTQPLLRGFGYEAGLESLVQAERDLLYSIREFELFRENFTIDVARRFYSLVQQKQGLDNQRRNLADVVFGRRQAEAMFTLGDTSELEVLRARRSELTSRNDLISAEEDLRRALESFRIFLGLPDGSAIEIADEAPHFVAVDFDVDHAIEVALRNRLDVLTRRERLQDSERRLRLANNSALPSLDLSASYGVGADYDVDSPVHQFDPNAWSVGVNLDLPVDQTDQRQSVRNAQIGHRQALRSYEEFQQNLVVEIRSAFRELKRRTLSLDIQRQLIADQERNAKIAQLRFEQGDFSNRDVVEAQQALLEARNALIREQVDYEIARLGLIRDLGILFIDERGMWSE